MVCLHEKLKMFEEHTYECEACDKIFWVVSKDNWLKRRRVKNG